MYETFAHKKEGKKHFPKAKETYETVNTNN